MRNSVLVAAMVAWATSRGTAQDAETYLHKAYFFETQEGRLAEAAELYEKVLQQRDAPEAMHAKAKRRLAGCREQLRSADLLSLLPEGALAYLEVRKPGTHLARIVEKIGLTRDDIAPDALPFGISPRLLDALQEGHRLALALTDIDPRQEVPEGVVIFDAGQDNLAFGALDTMLSSAAAAGELEYGEPIHGHATYQAPVGVVAVTERLIIAGHPRERVARVIDRLQGESSSAVAESLGSLAAERQNALAFAWVDGQRLIEKLKEEVGREGRVQDEIAMLQAFADIDHLQFAALRLSTDDAGIAGDLMLELEEDNHAVAYHLLRTPAVSDTALAAVPADAAVAAAFRLSEADGLGAVRSAATWKATGLDIGREIFGNIDDAVVFLVPPGDGAASGPVPDVALVLDVKDSQRSEALWTELLRVGATIARETPEVRESTKVAGQDVQVYQFPDHMNLYFCGLDDRVVLGTTQHAIARAIGVAAGEPSLLGAARFREAVAGVKGASKIAVIDIDRVLATLGPLLEIPEREARQIREVIGESLVTLSTRETAASLRGSVRIGWPRVGPWLRDLLGKERGERRGRGTATARRRAEPQASRPPSSKRRSARGQKQRARTETVPSPNGVPSRTARSVRGEAAELVQEFIPLGALWSYFDQGTNPGADWNCPDATVKKWKRGPAPLGYGDKALATVVSYGGNAQKKHATTFFRRTFTMGNPQEFDAFRIRLRRDDGVAVYLNGKPVARDNLRKGASWKDYCASTIGGPDEMKYLELPIDPAAMRAGKNVIAVEIHQATPGSSDIAFDLGLEGVQRRHDPERKTRTTRSRKF